MLMHKTISPIKGRSDEGCISSGHLRHAMRKVDKPNFKCSDLREEPRKIVVLISTTIKHKIEVQ